MALTPDRHCLLYRPTPGELTRAIVDALADKPRLETIAREGRRHVLAELDRSGIARRMHRHIDDALVAAGRPRLFDDPSSA